VTIFPLYDKHTKTDDIIFKYPLLLYSRNSTVSSPRHLASFGIKKSSVGKKRRIWSLKEHEIACMYRLISIAPPLYLILYSDLCLCWANIYSSIRDQKRIRSSFLDCARCLCDVHWDEVDQAIKVLLESRDRSDDSLQKGLGDIIKNNLNLLRMQLFFECQWPCSWQS